MVDLPNPFDGVALVFRLIGESATSTFLSSVGLLLIVIAIAFSVMIARNRGAVPSGHKIILLTTLIGGMLFSAAGPSVALVDYSKNVIPRITREKALDNLAENSRVGWLIRLIQFDPAKQNSLTIDSLASLGREDHKFSFVAPYEELKGLSAAEAIQKLGGTRYSGHRVSAVIFPVPKEEVIYPGNARGVLQVAAQVESGLTDGRFLVRNSRVLTRDEEEELNDTRIWTWRFDNYKDKYIKYCRLTHAFRCESDYTAKRFIGDLNHDWHPLGLSQSVDSDPCRMSVEKACASNDWDTLKRSVQRSFGSRIFLIRNLSLKDLPGRIMIDFNNPEYQTVPDIGVQR